jgi:hypothetical protein
MQIPVPRVLIIPLWPIHKQKVSERMQERISALEEEGALLGLESWTEIPELPAWVFVKDKREIAFIIEHPTANDAYRYAVVLGKKEQLIVVRAGGIAGTYQIFVRPKKPNKSPVPTSGLRTRAVHL